MGSDLDRLGAALAGVYGIERELGRGGMATVYLANDLKHHRQVAIKVMLPELASSIGAERFLREIRIAARLSHPHIVPLLDSGDAGGSLYYVMPFEAGDSLRSRLQRDGPLPLDEVARIVGDVASALAFAHERGVVHRDMKPENVLLSSGGAVVADFGIARLIHETGGDRLTSMGLAIGTPTYMSPEQASGERDVGPAGDTYSLGCVAYEMLVGEAPFSGPTMQAVIARHAVAPVPSVHAVRPSVSGAVDRVFEKALAKLPVDRFTTPVAFSQALSAALALPSGADAALTRRGAWGGRRRVVAAALATFVVAAAVVAALWTTRPDRLPMIAVLPFQNLGSEQDEYFADGVTDEMTSRISNISALGVISRTSAAHYKRSRSSLRDIARELGADFILSGTVRTDRARDGSGSVRVTPALVRVSENREIWTRQYDAQLVPGDIIRLQASIAEQVAAEMNVKLQAAERRGFSQPLTGSREAYEYFLRGNAAVTDYLSEAQTRRAVEMFEQAVQFDPSFVQAWAKLAQSQSNYYFFFDRRQDRLAKAQEAVNRAVALQPDLPEVHLAVGFLNYWGHADYDGALREFEHVRRFQPNNAELLWAVAQTLRRKGRWEESRLLFERAVQLSPRSEQYMYDLASTNVAMRRFADAGRDFDKAIALNPQAPIAYVSRALYILASTGDTAAARKSLEEGQRRVGTGALLAMLVHPNFRSRLGSLGVVIGDSLDALTLRAGGLDTAAYHLSKAEWNRLRERPLLAKSYYDSARVVLAARAQARPDDPAVHAELGMALAGLGLHDQAIAEARLAVRLYPLSKDALGGISLETNLAYVYTLVGESDSAIAALDRLRRLPTAVTEAEIRLGARWAPLRANPKFQSLLTPVN
jgi:serine/threonine-protein kinase